MPIRTLNQNAAPVDKQRDGSIPSIANSYYTNDASLLDDTDSSIPTQKLTAKLSLCGSKTACIGECDNTAFTALPSAINQFNAKDFFRYDHTPICFQGGISLGNNFDFATAIPFDIDNSLSDDPMDWFAPEDIMTQLKKLGINFWMVASRNHLLPKEGKEPRPKFHVYLPLSTNLYDKKKYVRYCEWCIKTFNGDIKVKSPAQKIFGYGDNPNVFIENWGGGRYVDEVLTDDDLSTVVTPAVTRQQQHAAITPVVTHQTGNTAFDWFVQSGEWRNQLGVLEARGWRFLDEKDGQLFFQTPDGSHAPGMHDGNIKDGVAYMFSRAPKPFVEHKGYSICQLFAGAIYGNIDSQGLGKFAGRFLSDANREPVPVSKAKNISAASDLPQVQSKNSRVKLTRFEDIEDRPPEWFMFNKVPANDITIISGEGGGGKTYFTCHLAAHVTNGHPWADKSLCEKGSVIFFPPEGQKSALKRRLIANGVDLSKCRLLEGKMSYDANSGTHGIDIISLADATWIADAIDAVGEETGTPVKMVVVDPVGNFTGKSDSYKDTEVRQILAPLQQIADEKKVTFILVAHHNKAEHSSAQKKVMGSGAWVNVARAHWVISVDKEDKHLRYFAPSKFNDCKDPTAISYRIVSQGDRWEGQVQVVSMDIDKTATDIMQEQRQGNLRGRPPEKRDGAKEFLKNYLADGAQFTTEIYAAGAEKLFSESTIDRAKAGLRILSLKDKTGKWKWQLHGDGLKKWGRD